MHLEVLHDRPAIHALLKNIPGLHAYELGDLDDFFWPKTIWYALRDRSVIHAIALVYVGMETPTLLSFHQGDAQFHRQLMRLIRPVLPHRFYAHLSSELSEELGQENILESFGQNYKMVLTRPVPPVAHGHIRKLSVSDLPATRDFYGVAYPHNWFDERMLGTGKYFGFFADERLVGISGVHVYSQVYRIAALGNIATHPDFRGRGIGTILTAALCADLQESVDQIGLNVRSDNLQAIRCYRRIGFEICGSYGEYLFRNGSS